MDAAPASTPPDLDTALLRVLCLLGEEPHLGRAARRLGITQQAASQRVARLEGLLGRELLDRSVRGRTRLSADARELLPWARAVVTATDRLTTRAADLRSVLRIDVMDASVAPASWMHGLARPANGGDADGAAVLVMRPADATAETFLLTRRADVAFGRLGGIDAPLPSWLRHTLVRLEPLSLLLPAGHPWADRESVGLSELAGTRLWFPMAMAPLEWRLFVSELAATWDLDVATEGSTLSLEQWAGEVTEGRRPPSLLGESMERPSAGSVSVPISAPTPVFPWSALWRDDLPDAVVLGALDDAGVGQRPTLGHGPPPDAWMPASDVRALWPDHHPER